MNQPLFELEESYPLHRPKKRFQFASAEWFALALAITTALFAGISLLQFIELRRRWTPKIEIVEKAVPVTAASDAEKPVGAMRFIPRRASDLIDRAMKEHRFVIKSIDPEFVLLREPGHESRIYLAIEIDPQGMIAHAELSMLVKDSSAVSRGTYALADYVRETRWFFDFFELTKKINGPGIVASVTANILKGVRDEQTLDAAHCVIQISRGPRDFQDAFLLQAIPFRD